MTDWKEGQQVFVRYYTVYSANPRPENKVRIISKIGRRWITLDNGDKFDNDTRTIEADVRSRAGSVFSSEASLEAAVMLQDLVDDFQRFRNLREVPGLTPEQVAEFAAAIGLKVPSAKA